MRLLVIRGDLQSHSGYSAAARDYCRLLARLVDRLIGVDIHYSAARPYEPFPHPIVSDAEAQRQAASADDTLVLSFTTPNHYARYPHAVNLGLTFWETDRLPLDGAEQSPWVEQANRMDALWAPSSHTKTVFEQAGVTVPIRVVPWPIGAPEAPPPGLPDGDVYDLDRHPRCGRLLVALGRFREPRFRWSRWLMNYAGPRAVDTLLTCLRRPAALAQPRMQTLLCVAQDVPRKGLLLLLSEWMEFKRRPEAATWSLIVKSTPIDPQTSRFDFVARFWEHVLALKRQLRVDRADVQLWAGDLSELAYHRLLAQVHGLVAPSLGEGFCGPAALALAQGKPLLAPRHTAFADYIADDYPYAYATRPARIAFVRDPLRVYDPASTWHVPEPLALANALSRLASDSSARRTENAQRAACHFAQWCSPERVAGLLAEEVQRLLSSPGRVAA
jgi:glycosyltransferase involved in cell wall biosynthesis